MRAIVMMFDSLNRRFLPGYGCEDTITLNFKRLAQHTVTFDQCYGGSLPCIPARRELQTGRYNFLHRNWGPMEPFDDSMPDLLSKHGIYTHLVTDHCHYWQEGGATYHTRFSSAELIRGQEGDFWKGHVDGFDHNVDIPRQDRINREYMQEEVNHPHVQTFRQGMEFLEKNVDSDHWFLQLEYFDPHEPYFAPQAYKKRCGTAEESFDWPFYGEVTNPELIDVARKQYSAVLAMCDTYLGKLLDFMDEHDMWKDTMLIVNTDHGFLLGEHGCFAKNYMPCYDEIVHIPLHIWDPRCKRKGEHCGSLVQTIDLVPTILDFFEIAPTARMQGKVLREVIASDSRVREYALFGLFGKHINITDGRYVYLRAARNNEALNNYTIMPVNMFVPYSLEDLREAELSQPDEFPFTQGVPMMKIPARDETAPQNNAYLYSKHMAYGDLLFDLQTDPEQNNPCDDPEQIARLSAAMKRLMQESEAPQEQYERMELR